MKSLRGTGTKFDGPMRLVVIANLVDPCVNDEARCYRFAIRDPRRVQGPYGGAYTLSFLGASRHLPLTSF